MPDAPLNPDALEAACLAAIQNESPGGSFADEEDRQDWLAWMRPAVSAYLAVAQPELQANSKQNQNFEVVNSVEELDALPAGTLVKSGGREFYKTSYVELPWILPYGVDRFGSSCLAKHSKVTVIHRPEVES